MQFCCVWSFRNLEMPDVPVYSVKAHKEILNSIDGVGGLGIGDGAPEIVTGSRDGESSDLSEHSQTWEQHLIKCQCLPWITGTVKVWDPRQKDSPVANMEPTEGENKRDCWTVAFGLYCVRSF